MLKTSVMKSRIDSYSIVSKLLAKLSDQELVSVLQKAAPLHSGIGGTSALLKVEEHSIFVKKLPLTDLECQPKNRMTTQNIFNLPLFCHYGVGSPGFGAWRELSAHRVTTDWVLSAECANFPILFHWRVVPKDHKCALDDNLVKKIDDDVRFWGNSSEVRHRLESIYSASADLVLFLEYFPQNLLQWVHQEMNHDGDVQERALQNVEKSLLQTNDFLRRKSFVHFDAHFENILTNGEDICFSDFGLSLYVEFNLSASEKKFLNSHKDYDLGRQAVGLIHAILTSRTGVGNWRAELRKYLAGDSVPFAKGVDAIIRKYSSLATVMSDFSHSLCNERKNLPYPEDQISQTKPS
jgi:hypothetical protein